MRQNLVSTSIKFLTKCSKCTASSSGNYWYTKIQTQKGSQQFAEQTRLLYHTFCG